MQVKGENDGSFNVQLDWFFKGGHVKIVKREECPLERVDRMDMYDVIVIGAGVSGASVARELARHQRRIGVLEKALDVCEGTSKANSGLVHAGHDAMPGTLKAMLNVQGNVMMEALAEELNFPFQRNGSLVLCFEEKGIEKLEELLERGKKNGVRGLRILSGEEVRELEPAVSKEVKAALYSPMGGIVCPFGMNVALAENACVNGVEFYFGHEVTKIEKISSGKGGFRIRAACEGEGEKEFTARAVVNAAGLYADVMHNMVSKKKMSIIPRRGQYCLLDKRVGDLVSATLFQLPSRQGKGILVTPTVHGNLLIGPTAEDIRAKEGVNTTAEGLRQVLQMGKQSVPHLPEREVITSFAGLRAHIEDGEKSDFMIGEAADAPGFFDVAGIESPGLSCAPALGKYVAGLIQEKYRAPKKEDFLPVRKGIPDMDRAGEEERENLIKKNAAYANVVCRCEMVTEGEILDAINRPLGATTLDGIKRRVRAGMGRCQAGFCTPKVTEILSRELSKVPEQIVKSGVDSRLFQGVQNENA